MTTTLLQPSRELNQRPQGEDGAGSFTPSYHREMLLDVRRVHAFQKAIKYYGNQANCFMEFGIGTGVMCAYASRFYKHVYAVEKDPVMYEVAKSNLQSLGLLEKNVTLINADVLTDDLPKADVIMAELMSTLMIHEPEVPALNRAKHEYLNSGGHIIPQRVVNTVTPVWSKFDTVDIVFKSPYTLFSGVNMPEQVGETKPFYVADFSSASLVDNTVKRTLTIECFMTSEINSLVFSSIVQLAPNITFSGSDSLNPPMVVPVEPVYAKAGDKINIHISYDHFTDWNTLKVSVHKA